MNPSFPEGYHPPHPHHAHAPHVGEPPRPDIQYVHPHILRDEQAKQAQKDALVHEHPGWAAILFLVTMVPSAYCSYAGLRKMGWFMIIPPLPFIAPAFLIMGEMV